MTHNGFPTGSLEDIVFQEATATVFAVSNARLRGHEEDAAAVIIDYLRFGTEKGLKDTRCWSLLFAASVAQFTTLVSELATAGAEDDPTSTSEDYLAYLALDHAAGGR